MYRSLSPALFLLLLFISRVQAVTTLTVAKDGSAEFASIQAALDTIPVDNRSRIVIEIRDGVYSEKVRVDQNCITLRGESRSGTRIAYNLPRPEYDRRYDRLGPGVVNLFGEDIVLENLTVENTQPDAVHAFAIYGQPQRLILNGCDVLGVGDDTLSLWNTALGMYYHRDCTFRGGVDFVCPRGWCYVCDSRFEPTSTSAALWHDGHMNLDMKFVLRNCEFDGAENFWLGRNHYPSQFYLVDCHFSEKMADKPIGVVADPRPDVDPAAYERKYFFNCHRAGGDFAWHADNMPIAPGEVTARWTFDGRWDPETTAPPRVETVEVSEDEVHVYFSVPLAGASKVAIVRQDGSRAELMAGDGTRQFVFAGGSADSAPVRFDFGGDRLYATTATLDERFLTSPELPAATPRREVTILVVGDSTVADYTPERKEMGWGQALPQFLDDRVRVVNRARNGRSSKSFRDEGLWDEALKTPADYVLIQFGHNDNPGKGPERETDPSPGGDFRENLRRYVEEVRQAGATPVLVSPTTRRFYTAEGVIDPAEANVPYAEATLAVAQETKCAVIELNTLTCELFNRLEETHSHHLQPSGDRTHFTPTGAREIARLVALAFEQQVPELRPYFDQQELVRH